jgi:hypothetical protein
VPGIRRAVAVTAGPDHTIVLTAAALPPLPLADHPMFEHRCRETGRLLEESVEHAVHTAKEVTSAEADDEGTQRDGTPEVAAEDKAADDDSTAADESGVPSLFALCQRQLAKTVTAKTAVCALMCAEQVSATELERYCVSYLQRYVCFLGRLCQGGNYRVSY